MNVLILLLLTLAADVATRSGKDKKRRNDYFGSFFRRIETQKQQFTRNASSNNEGIKYSRERTKGDGRYTISDKEAKTYFSKNATAATRFELNNSNATRNTDNNANVLPYTFSEKEPIERAQYLTIGKANDCKISVAESSIQYFQNQLLANKPHFIQFRILQSRNTIYNSTKDVFQAGRWYWTYNTSSGPYPFLSWNLDYGLLTFGLLDAKTIHIPYVNLSVSSGCSVMYGTNRTSFQITNALKSLVNFTEDGYIRYPESYFCYLVIDDKRSGTLRHYAAQYLMYPCSFIRYKCCTVIYNYYNKNQTHSCPEGKIPGIHTWTQTSLVPFIFGILLLAFCPIPMFNVFAWAAKRDRIVGNDLAQSLETSCHGFQLIENEENWIYADGVKSPLTFFDLFSFDVFGLQDTYPILTSRLRRFLCVTLAPSMIYIQIAWYTKGLGVWNEDDKINVENLVEAGTPMGFLSILADTGNKHKTFVPGLGGPLVVSIMYFAFGVLFLVLPRCLKQIVEDGLPSTNLYIPSPLCFGYKEIVKMSKISIEPEQLEPGYTKGSNIMKCSFYLLFTTKFWIRVWRIQTRRISCYSDSNGPCFCILAFLMMPPYLTFCIIEIIACFLYYGLPFVFLVVVMVKGASKALRYLIDQGRFLSWVFSFKIIIVLGVCCVFMVFSLLVYIYSLLFFISFGLITQVITLCFIAVIVYPSVSFGYIFFFVNVLYYFIKQIRSFSDVYTDLLSTAVDISNAIAHESFNISLLEGCLNVNCEDLREIRINGRILNNTEEFMVQDIIRPLKIRKKNNVFGIPGELFDILVKKHRPVHQQVLKLVFKVSIMIAFILLTWSISSNYVTGPTTEVSEVMHVIFIVVVGVIPQLIGVAFANSNSVLVREIEERKIEQSVREYWSTR